MKAGEIPLSTIIEVIRIKGDEVVKKEMTLQAWSQLEKLKGYEYKAYQKGYSQYNLK